MIWYYSIALATQMCVMQALQWTFSIRKCLKADREQRFESWGLSEFQRLMWRKRGNDLRRFDLKNGRLIFESAPRVFELNSL